MSRLWAGFALSSLLLAGADCKPTQGERCNPLQFDVGDQCSDGLACVYPPNCAIAFCCPPGAAAASAPPLCTFPPDCSGDGCCPAMAAPPPSTKSANCLPCAALDGGPSD